MAINIFEVKINVFRSDINLLLCSSHIQTSTKNSSKSNVCNVFCVYVVLVVNSEGIWRVFWLLFDCAMLLLLFSALNFFHSLPLHNKIAVNLTTFCVVFSYSFFSYINFYTPELT